MSSHYQENKEKNITSLKKMQSLCGTLIDKIEKDTSCSETLHQLKALSGLMKNIEGRILQCELESLLDEEEQLSQEQRKEKQQEIEQYLKRVKNIG